MPIAKLTVADIIEIKQLLDAKGIPPRPTIIDNPGICEFHDILIAKPIPAHLTRMNYIMSVRYLHDFYSGGIAQYFECDGQVYIGDAVELYYRYICFDNTTEFRTWIHDNATLTTQAQRINYYSLVAAGISSEQ